MAKKTDGNDIVQFLENKLEVKMPEQGLLAGQAVASAYFELKNLPFGTVYNDIDIFTDIDTFNRLVLSRNIKIPNSNYDNKTIDFYDQKNFRVENNYPSIKTIKKCFTSSTKRRLLINDSVRQGLFNFISYSYINLETLLKNFDINSVQIGIDLATGQLKKTRNFEEFIRTGYLKVSSFSSPHHSIIRLCNKINFVQDKCSLEEDFLKLATLIEMDNRWIKNNVLELGRYPYFGKKKYQEFLDNKNVLLHYFDVTPHQELPMFQLKPKFDILFKEFEGSLVRDKRWSSGNIIQNDLFYKAFVEFSEDKMDALFKKASNPTNKNYFKFFNDVLSDLLPKKLFNSLTHQDVEYLKDNIEWVSLIAKRKKSWIDEDIVQLIEKIKNKFGPNEQDNEVYDVYQKSKGQFQEEKISLLKDPNEFLVKNIPIKWLEPEYTIFYFLGRNCFIVFCVDNDNNLVFMENEEEKNIEKVKEVVRRKQHYSNKIDSAKL